MSGLRGDTERDTSRVAVVQQRVDALNDERHNWLRSLWTKVKGLPPTAKLMDDCWKGYVDELGVLKHRKAGTKTATTFTLARFARWEGLLKAWINSPEVLEVGLNEARQDKALHYLSCIINVVEEVS